MTDNRLHVTHLKQCKKCKIDGLRLLFAMKGTYWHCRSCGTQELIK